MNIKKLGKVVAAATAASLAAALLSATAANAAATTPPQFYYADGGDGHILPDGQVMAWTDQVLALPGTSPEDLDRPFIGSADAEDAASFIAPVGQENNISAWMATGFMAFTPGTKNILQPNISLSGFYNGNWATPKNGGQWSVGFAWVKNNGLTLASAGVRFVTIDVKPGGAGDWTFPDQAQPPADVAPEITTTSLTALTKGTAFTQTIAATGTAPITWSVSAGTLPAGLALDTTTGVISGTPTAAGAYSFTLTAANSKSDEQAFSGTVYRDKPVPPTDPSTKVTIVDPAEAATTITVPAGVANKGKTLNPWAWSDPTSLPEVTADPTTGDAVVDISSLDPGSHTVGLYVAGDPTLTAVAWGTFTVPEPIYPPPVKTVDVQAEVTASNLWSLEAEKTSVDFGEVARGATKTLTDGLGKVTVIDDRKVLDGWTLTALASPFTLTGADPIPATALAITPKAFAGYTPTAGITTGGSYFASSDEKVSTGTTGALFNADLAFTAPNSAQAGVYQSTLTFTLTTK